MDAEELDDLFGRIALEKEYISEDELNDALDARRHLRDLGIGDKTLADIMQQKGYISEFEKEEIVLQLEAGAESGTTVHGYQVLLELEHDRPGKLYKAYQRAMDRTVLLRVLSKTVAEEATLIPTLKREAKLVAKLQHPAIVAGYDAGETEDEYFLVSEFVEGIRLSQLIELEGSLGEEEAVKIALKIVRALEYLEEQGIVHRDIEPENILVTKSGGAKIASFGLAVMLDNVTGTTQENILTATPFYMSPEQAKGFSDLDVRSDLFSLGATFYHMLTGHLPFGADTEMVLALIVTKDVADPRTLAPDISQPVAEIVLKLMKKEQDDRFQSAAEVRQRIEGLLAAEPGAGARAKPRKSARSKRRRMRHASRMFSAQTGPAPRPASPIPAPAAAVPLTPPAPRPFSAAVQDSGALRPKSEAVRPRTAAVTAAKTSSSNTAIFAMIGLVVAVIIIIAAVAYMPSGSKPREPQHTPAPKPREGGDSSGPKVSDVSGEDTYPEDVKKFRELKRLQNEFPDSPELIAKYNEFLAKVKDPDVKKAAEMARNGAISAFYESSNEKGKKLRREHRYAEALALYKKLLGFIPESEKAAIQQTKVNMDRTRAEADMRFTAESSRAEGLIDRGDVESAIAIYESLKKNSVDSNAEMAGKIVERLKGTGKDDQPGPTAAIPEEPGPGPDDRTPEQIEAEEKKKRAEARLRAMKHRIIAELQAQITDHVRGLRIGPAKRIVKKALEEKKDPMILEEVRKVEKHVIMIEKAMAAIDRYMQELYKKNIIELWLKKRQVLLGELIKYESGVLIFKKRNNDTVQIRLSEVREDEVERYLLEGLGDKNKDNLLCIAVFFVYFYGDTELTRKYIGQAQAKGADVKEYLDLLRGASFEASLMMAEDDLKKKKYFSAYMKLCKLRADFAQTEAYKERKELVEELTDEAYAASGLGRLFVGKLTCRPPLFEIFYDFSHSSQLNDFTRQLWDAKSTRLESEIWRPEEESLAGGGEGALVWHGEAQGELAIAFFAEPREIGAFEVLLFADPSKLYNGRAYAFGFSAIVDEDDEHAEAEHYIALWDGKKQSYKYLKRGIMKPALEEKKTYLVQIIARHDTLQMFINDKLLGEVKDTTLDSGTVVLRVKNSLVYFDNLTIKANFDEGWLRKSAKDAK